MDVRRQKFSFRGNENVKRQKFNPWRIGLYFILLLVSVITLYPFLWMLAASFMPLAEIVRGGMSLIRPGMSLDNYRFIFGSATQFPRWFMNSLIVATIGTIINVILNTMAGYSLSRLEYPGRQTVYYALLALIMIPSQVLLVPNVILISRLGMMDSYAALIVPAMVNIGFIFLMRQFFVNFPSECEEAAYIDGLGRITCFFRMVMPLARTAIATQAILVFMGFWNEFTRPMLYLRSMDLFTLPLGLQQFQSRDAGQMWNQIMAAAAVTVIPILILYLLFNKYFMRGIRTDGEK